MPPNQRRRQRQAAGTQDDHDTNRYADDITVGSQSVISALTAGTTFTRTANNNDDDISGWRRSNNSSNNYYHQKRNEMRTINDDGDDNDDDMTVYYTSAAAVDEDDLSVFSRYIHLATNNVQMKNMLGAASIILIMSFIAVFYSSSPRPLQHDGYSSKSKTYYKGVGPSSALSSLMKQEEIIRRNAHNLISIPPGTIREQQLQQRRQQSSTKDEAINDNNINNNDRNDDMANDRGLLWKFEPETVEIREQHPLLPRPNLNQMKMQQPSQISNVNDNNNMHDEQQQQYQQQQRNDIPLNICGRPAAIPLELDQEIMTKFQTKCRQQHQQSVGPDDPILLIEGISAFGRTGNNLIEFLHALERAQNEGMTVGIMIDSWIVPVITSMWMAIQNNDIDGWKYQMERTFCIKMLTQDELPTYTNIIRMETRDLFMYKTKQSLPDYIEFQTYHIRNLFRNYNTGVGVDIRNNEVNDMCSGIDAMFGRRPNEEQSSPQIYSVIHSRNLEGKAGHELLARVAKNSGCDPEAALNLPPDYIKAILEPIGMLNHPIVFLTDHQRPEILQKLLADKDIGPMIRLVQDDASWVGGDITLGVMSNVFIGNPASTFSGFIAKSRLALGFENNYLFRAKNKNGEWEDVCEKRCVFWKRILWNMA